MPSESPPESPPRFFIDRSLGRIAVPGLLRKAGWDVVTLAEHYGIPADEDVTDVQWIAETAALGWPVLMKDKRIRYRPAEIEAVIEHGARCFVILAGTSHPRRRQNDSCAIISRSTPRPANAGHLSIQYTSTASTY
jgi:PIN like domain